MNKMKSAAILCTLLLGCSMTALAADTVSASQTSTGAASNSQAPAWNSAQGMPPPMPGNGGGMPPGGFNPPDHVTQGTAAKEITKDADISYASFTSTGNDENALRITGASVSLSHVSVSKTRGTSSSTEGGDFYGMNAAVLATDKAQLSISKSSIMTSVSNGNGLFSYGDGTLVVADDVRITTTGNNSGGLQTTGGGETLASNMTVSTSGNSSAAIRSDRGGGTVVVDGGTFKTEGYGSPAIYSTADITVKNAELTATHSEGAVIEGKNSISLENCHLTGDMASERVMGPNTIKEENVHGVMIYQSMSGDAEEGESHFTMKDGSLTTLAGDTFYVTNTDCTIDLNNVDIDNQDADGIFLRVAGNNAERGWGTAGANGGKATFTADNQLINGDISVDSTSELHMTLKDKTVFKGAIQQPVNDKGTVEGHGVYVTIEKGATWELTGDSTVTELTNHGTIHTNGHELTVLSK